MFPIYPFILVLSVLLSFFLFWRACRHELIDSEVAFDLSIVGVIGALVFARIFEFIVKFSEFDWSLAKLLFLNVYPGADFYGALFGLIFAISVLARVKKLNVLATLDLLAAPLVFAQGVIALGKYLTAKSNFNIVLLLQLCGFLILFWILKRLAKMKRHPGFFISLYLFGFSIVEIVLFWWRDDVVFIKNIPYQLVAPLVIGQATLIFWYVVAGRNFAKDLKNFSAYFLLSIFRFKRMIAEVEEAGKFSRSIILGPFWLAREMVKLLKLIVREIFLGCADFLHVLGVGR